jgi:carbamoyltransferase
MEFGPRALGNRSILARSDQEQVKDRLNLFVKKREWFQPFAPSILEEDINRIIEYDHKGLDKYMTMAYMVKEDMRKHTTSMMHVDGSARPQVVGEENILYMNLLKKVKSLLGNGIVMNTSFNIHGYPIVMEPAEAIKVLKTTKSKYLFMNGVFVTNRAGAY